MADHSDDSPFVSASDFFSLISLTLIYGLIAVREPNAGLGSAATEVQVVSVASVAARDPFVAYVTVSSVGKDLRLTVMPSQADEFAVWTVADNLKDYSETKAWVMKAIVEGAQPSQVVFYMSDDEENAQAHKLFNQLLSLARREYSVIQAFQSGANP